MTAPPPSLWLDGLDSPITPTRPLARDIDVDVAIVGAGFTGLWTAYYLKRARPDARITIVDKEFAGFGASGRNGGWASALLPTSIATLAKEHGRDSALAFDAAMRASVDELIAAADDVSADAHITKGGTVVVARTELQWERAQAEVSEADEFGLGDRVHLLDRDAAATRLNATGTLGGTYTPDCAVIQPARLVRALAAAVQDMGVDLYEGTPATAIGPHRVATPGGEITAAHVIRATEGYTAQLPGYKRAVAPVYSLMIATAPLSDPQWQEIGLAQRETFSDYRHLIVYGQRTADGRMIFGGRGAPYHFGSATRPEFDTHTKVFAKLQASIVEMFPTLAGTPITHRWGGALGIARDWHASVGLDADTGIGWAGGYVGDGVTTTNLAGRTLRDLILGEDTALTHLPWVGHRSRRWEVEPLRWLGANAGLVGLSVADAEERLTRRPSVIARALSPLVGGHL
ncbi:NAD(P)/FAD-dependent oxidoreductase [Demequina aurantiaca]|uniref:NAD(P)/FAD-dependent oxidoreductase n=1 Tax=Demequina aurantiaca TaxID=676200 RepID=UPI0007843DFD|nr:FAD-binding oxidoreductase [Demequina aurantiaca]